MNGIASTGDGPVQVVSDGASPLLLPAEPLESLEDYRAIGGGVALARDPASITLADIIEAVEGPIAMTQCSGSHEASDCALDARCRVKPHMTIVTRTVREALAGVTLAHLAQQHILEDA